MTDKYAVIGNPIGHTKSPMIHGSFAQATGQDIDYSAIEGSLERFADDVHAFRKAGGRGMNVTAPSSCRPSHWPPSGSNAPNSPAPPTR